MGFASFISSATTSWSAYYSDHQMVSLVIRYLHIAALMVGGGTALAIDRVVLGSARRTRTDDRRHAAWQALQGSHRVVVPALLVVTMTGVLMTAADWATFEVSRIFWFKMVTFLLLVINGAVLVAAERRYAQNTDVQLWRRVILASGASCLLWLIVLWIGEWLTIAA